MRLIKARVRCVKGVNDSGWFVPGRETTVIFGPPHSGKSHLLRALQALNPPYDISRERPLDNHPPTWHQGDYSRRVFPQKKTAVFMIFSAEPKHVAVLGQIDPDLIETDRIEVGRRLDYSRWTSFVEISASARWSEIAESMQRLHAGFAGRSDLPDSSFLTRLDPADRLKGEAADNCLRWLHAIEPLVVPNDRETYQRCLTEAGRRGRFLLAEKQVAEWLPLTLYLDPEQEVQSAYSYADIFAEQQEPLPAVLALLRLLCAKFQLHESGGGRSEAMTEAVHGAVPLLRVLKKSGLTAPTLRSDRRHVYIEGNSARNGARNGLEQRMFQVGVICLLAELCHGHRPLLLLDCFDRDLSSGQRLQIAAFQQRLGGLYQLLATTEHEEVADADGWQAVTQIGADGLLGAKPAAA